MAKWEVTRIYGDDRPHVRTLHTTPELAERAYDKAFAEGLWYAVDVTWLGLRHDYEPMYGIANGFYWYGLEGYGPVWSHRGLNE